MRYNAWKNQIENGFYICEHYREVHELAHAFFEYRYQKDSEYLLKPYIELKLPENKRQLCRDLNISALEELCIVVISPTILLNGDYAYTIDSMLSEKCHIAGMKKGQLGQEEIKMLFEFGAGHSLLALVLQ